MSIIHYIDTSVAEQTQARMASLTNRVPQSFPALMYGDTRSHEWIFHYAGNVEPFSGNASYSLRVTLGDPVIGPQQGSFLLSSGTNTAPIHALADAAALEYALNLIPAVAAAGGVAVFGKWPSYITSWNVAGAQNSIGIDGSRLYPPCACDSAIVQAGDSTDRQVVAITLRQYAVAQQSNWATTNSPANGWYGPLPITGTTALPFLFKNAKQVGALMEAETAITAEVIETSTNYASSYFQSPLIIRFKPTAAISQNMSTSLFKGRVALVAGQDTYAVVFGAGFSAPPTFLSGPTLVMVTGSAEIFDAAYDLSTLTASGVNVVLGAVPSSASTGGYIYWGADA